MANALTAKSLETLNFIKNYNGDLTLNTIAAELEVEPKSINGTLVSLQRKGLIERVEAGVENVDGKAKIVKHIVLTEKGKAYDHDAAIEQDIQEKTAAIKAGN